MLYIISLALSSEQWINYFPSFWISDEYGPGIYRFSHEGHLEQSIELPDALLPRDASGNLNYTSVVNPAAGRTPNQGEGCYDT